MTNVTLYAGSNVYSPDVNSYWTAALWNDAQVTFLDASHGPSSGAFIVGFVSGEQKAKYFYSSSANSVNLPTIVAPNALPPSNNTGGQNIWTGLGAASGPMYQLVSAEVPEFGGSSSVNAAGAILLQVSFSPGSPDAGSPGLFFLDANCLIITTTISKIGA